MRQPATRALPPSGLRYDATPSSASARQPCSPCPVGKGVCPPPRGVRPTPGRVSEGRGPADPIRQSRSGRCRGSARGLRAERRGGAGARRCARPRPAHAPRHSRCSARGPLPSPPCAPGRAAPHTRRQTPGWARRRGPAAGAGGGADSRPRDAGEGAARTPAPCRRPRGGRPSPGTAAPLYPARPQTAH